MKKLLVLSGPIAVGKSAFVAALEAQAHAERVSTSDWLKARGCADDRAELQAAGQKQDEMTGGRWVVNVIEEKDVGPEILVLDAARIVGQVEALKAHYGDRVHHIHLTASDETLGRRYSARPSDRREFATYTEAKIDPTEAAVETLAIEADLTLDADHTDPENLAQVALAYFDISAPQAVERLVDVIVGGQYGSEGKGNVCASIAHNYDALMRIGGPNAGHMVADPPYKYIQLPSGTKSNPAAKILVGAGSTLSLPQLLREILDLELSPERLTIDAQAMVVDDWDSLAEAQNLNSISSTGQGVGAANARKIANRGDKQMLGPTVRLARDIKQLSDYVGDVRAQLDQLFREGKMVLLEGTQGTALSIHHGLYPHVTSRETSVAGCLADAGISPGRVRKVIMVVRTYPIRVGGPSGWMGREIDFQLVSDRSGVAVEDIAGTEKGSVSGKTRRIAEFDWGQLRRASAINGPTEIAITFADYLGVSNREVTSFDDLNEEAQRFIEQVERVSGATVNLVSKKFAVDGVLKRGDWS